MLINLKIVVLLKVNIVIQRICKDYYDEKEYKSRLMSATLPWRNNTNEYKNKTNHSIIIGVLHPSFEKN
jgi:queuine/archaeosine tRNA-ribosyltransferase